MESAKKSKKSLSEKDDKAEENSQPSESVGEESPEPEVENLDIDFGAALAGGMTDEEKKQIFDRMDGMQKQIDDILANGAPPQNEDAVSQKSSGNKSQLSVGSKGPGSTVRKTQGSKGVTFMKNRNVSGLSVTSARRNSSVGKSKMG